MRKRRRAIRIVIADDHAIFRDGLRRSLEAERDFCVVGEAANGEEAVGLVEELKPDILLLDLAMPRVAGLEALRELAGSAPTLRTILLTATIEKAQIIEALQLGARGVVLKESAAELLYRCIRTVMAGQYWVGREHVSDLVACLRELAGADRTSSREQPSGLTKRELELVEAIVSGHTNKEIAKKLSISEDTVKHHLTNIFDKLGVSNRLELAVYAIDHGMISTR